MKKLILVVMAIAAVHVMNSCSKNSNKSKNCKIVTLSAGGESDIVSYNEQGKLQRIKTADVTMDVRYEGDSVFIVQSDTSGTVQQTAVRVNSDGLATSVRTVYKDKSWIAYTYQYGGQEVQTCITSHSDNTSEVTQYFWADHNLTSEVINKDTVRFSYYTDKAAQPGDYFYAAKLLQGYETVRNKNLIKAQGTATAFIYEFDTEGKIIKMTYTAGTNTAYIDYGYDCH